MAKGCVGDTSLDLGRLGSRACSGGCKAKDGQAHQVLDGRSLKAAKALFGCLKDSSWVYPAGER